MMGLRGGGGGGEIATYVIGFKKNSCLLTMTFKFDGNNLKSGNFIYKLQHPGLVHMNLSFIKDSFTYSQVNETCNHEANCPKNCLKNEATWHTNSVKEKIILYLEDIEKFSEPEMRRGYRGQRKPFIHLYLHKLCIFIYI